MGMTTKTGLRALLATASVVGVAIGTAAAQTNEAGEVISNTFTLNYNVGSTAQTPISNSASPTTFTVDRKVDLEVTAVGNATGQTPGATDVPLIYAVDNEGNDNFQFLLSVADNTTNGTGSGGTSDNFDTTDPATNVIRWYLRGATDTSCATTAGTYTNATTTTTDIPAGRTVCVRVLRDVPGAATDGEQAGVYLNAQARYPTAWANSATTAGTPGTAGGPLSQDNESGETNTINGNAQNVFLDGDGPNDGANDATDSDQGFVVVSSAPLTAVKYVYAQSTGGSPCTAPTTPVAQADVANEQFFVPGACVVYVIEADNTGGSNASGIAISDTLPTEVTYVASGANGFGSATVTPSGGCTSGGACTVAMSGGALASGSKGSLVIAATID